MAPRSKNWTGQNAVGAARTGTGRWVRDEKKAPSRLLRAAQAGTWPRGSDTHEHGLLFRVEIYGRRPVLSAEA